MIKKIIKYNCISLFFGIIQLFILLILNIDTISIFTIINIYIFIYIFNNIFFYLSKDKKDKFITIYMLFTATKLFFGIFLFISLIYKSKNIFFKLENFLIAYFFNLLIKVFYILDY